MAGIEHTNIYFITGNPDKLKEIKAFVPTVVGLDIDLPEIQEIDAEVIVKAKLAEAFKHHKGAFIVEDTSLYIEALNGLPGPLIKWFSKTIGNEGICRMAQAFGNNTAVARTIIGYARNEKEVRFFEGTTHGRIVAPRGEHGFGWDVIFEPEGYDKTFAEMSQDEKDAISMRKQAALKLSQYLNL